MLRGKYEKKSCDMECIGIIKNIKDKGLDSPTIVTVEYEVDGKMYCLKESIKYKIKLIKFGFIPIGQENIPKIKCKIGNEVTVLYNSKNPYKPYIKGNDGIINC